MIRSKILRGFLFFSAVSTAAFSSHNASRYFPFLEKTDDYVTKSTSFISPAFFITNAGSAHRHGGGSCGIPELWGPYDLKDVINSVSVATQDPTYNPFIHEPGYVDLNEKEIKFFMAGKVKSFGLILNAEQNLFKSDFSVGAFLPIMRVNTSLRFSFDANDSDPAVRSFTQAQVEMLDRVRRSVHKDLHLQGDDLVKSGVGDLDLYLHWHHLWDHVLKMKSIDLNTNIGALCPTGVTSNKDYPCSAPFMGNGHWGCYLDILSEFELKQNWKFGLLGGLIHQFKKTHTLRLPILKESTLFSALVAPVEIDPGETFKFSPYFTLENVSDGLHMQLRYTFLKHWADSWADKRSSDAITLIPSYLESTAANANAVRSDKRSYTKWTSHFITLQMVYDSVEAMKHWTFTPKFFAVYDYPFNGLGSCKTHQVTLGVQLHFW